jgi:hypothetical protein
MPRCDVNYNRMGGKLQLSLSTTGRRRRVLRGPTPSRIIIHYKLRRPRNSKLSGRGKNSIAFYHSVSGGV